jgi:hypothetical protein
MSDDVLTRWRGFVQKLTERYQAILTESNAGFEGLLQDPNLDPITFGNAMNAIELRCKSSAPSSATPTRRTWWGRCTRCGRPSS